MEKRTFFNSSKIRDLFFTEIFKSFKLKSWIQLSRILGVNRNILTDYRFGRLTLPKSKYERLISKLEKNKADFFNKNISCREGNLGSIQGGKVAYLKNKEAFDKGREKAIKIRREKVKRFDINLPLCENLSYFLGLFIGDGFTNKYCRYYLTQFVGHFPKEVLYYKEIISKISKELFDIIPQIKKIKDVNAIRVNLYSKDLFLLITKRFKIPKGRKSLIVSIPERILKSEEKIILSFIAGIYDAEGSFYTDKRSSYKKPYPILELHMHGLEMIRQISEIFDKIDIKHYVRANSRIYIYGHTNLKDFLKHVKLKNPKIIDKIKGYFNSK